MSPYILVIDIGNTSASVGLYRAGRVTRVKRLGRKDQRRVSIRRILREVAGTTIPSAVGIASVVPALNQAWEAAVHDAFALNPVRVNDRSPLGIPVNYPRPKTIGADRLANAVGAVRRYGAPVIVADFGTAVTFDLISRRDGFIGGIIAPGFPMMLDYLAERTAQLPRVAPGSVPRKVGRSTEEAMQLGARWGYRGMVREIQSELLKVSSFRRATLVATGGFARQVLQGVTPKPVIDLTLTLFGVGCVAENTLAPGTRR